jgi:hypothetical protein
MTDRRDCRKRAPPGLCRSHGWNIHYGVNDSGVWSIQSAKTLVGAEAVMAERNKLSYERQTDAFESRGRASGHGIDQVKRLNLSNA